ncbi:major facilitator superfamily domain-containing protein [Pseudomassariella vexata]|uniref:Major facilitator superfamily domain-containing protein n=1 Tax=Pseudomassariella vexata TaxID=1141098 RepID=A0A1Y2DFW0_9PEZI|nr:major facilitator superfamily domain-containing protein [Pseudomassariella vexata]ORY58183.1 major facilitator superfamily domain-containing protein [Pseudomassariella vexata]
MESAESPATEDVFNAKEAVEDQQEPVPHLHGKTFLAVFAVCFIYFAQLINVVGAGAQTQAIAAVFAGSSSSVWLTSVVAIMTVVLSPIISQAADYWGRRWFLISLTACGAIGSIVVARANSMNMAIGGFAVTGLSYGAQPLLHAVASEVLPRRYRPWGQGFTNASAALGGFVGLLAGGALTRNGNVEGFRNYWYMTTAIYAVATILTFVLYDSPKTANQTKFTNKEKLGKLDWIGYALLSVGLVLFCMGLSWSQNPFLWSDPHVPVPFAIGLFFIILLAVYETKFKEDGMFHHGLFVHGRNFAIALLCVFVEGLVFFAANNYFAFEVGVLYETDSLRIGLRYAVNMAVYGVSAVLAGLYCSTTKHTRWPTVAAFMSMIIFFVLMATATPQTSNPVWGYPVFLGMGLGVCLCALVTVAQLSTPKELIAITSGLMIGMRSLGGSVGLAIYNAIFNGELSSHLFGNIANAVLPLGLPVTSLGDFVTYLAAQDSASLMTVPGVTGDIIQAGAGALLETYSVGFRWVWVAAGSLTAVAAIAAMFLVDPKAEFNMHIDAPVEKEEQLYHS